MKREIASIIGATFLFLCAALVIYSMRVPLLDFWTGLALLSVAAGMAVLGWGLRPNIMRWTSKKRYSHLTLHYSQRKDTAEHPTRPYYTVNNRTRQAFWTPDSIRVLASKGIIEGVTHNGKTALLKYLEDKKIELIERYPMDNELGV